MFNSKEVTVPVIKMKPKTPSPPDTMEESAIILPMIEDTVIALGDLWDCRTSTSPGNIFEKPFEQKHLDAFPIQSLEYTLFQTKNTHNKMTSMKVSAEVSLEIAGLLKIAGSAKFEKEDTKKFNEEQLICNYKCSTFVVRVRQNTAELIDPIMKAKIIDGSCTATHYVQSVRIGGEATGDIRFNEMIDESNLTIGGSFEGSLSLGPVTAKAKASLEMLDEEYKENYETSVSVNSRPRFEKSPTNVKQMFEQIDTIDERLKAEKHFKIIGDHIVGVPLSFKLVPINSLFSYDNSKLFKLMEADIMNDFTSMIYTCQDYQLPNFIKGLLCEKERRLVTILKDEFNPFTITVSELEIECDKKAKEIKARAFKVYTLYKTGDKKIEDILDEVRYYDEYFNIMELTAHIQGLVEKGKKELNGIHASDAINLSDENNQPIVKFFTNEIDFTDWWTAERNIKILLQTNLDGVSPSGTFLRIFNYSLALTKLNVEVGINFPNISKNFSLTFKIHDKIVVYEKSDISFALEVLGVAIETGDIMSSLFYRITGVLTGLNLNSIAENLPDITSLVNIFKESRDITICETYPQLISKLTDSTNTWNFVLPLQGINCSLEMMKFFRQLREILPNQYPRIIHRWIIGRFNLTHYDSPLLFVFYDNELKAICLDHLDILILLNQFKMSVLKPDLSLLSHVNMKKYCLYPSRANFAVKILEGLVLDHSTELTELVPPMKDFPIEENEELTKAMNVTRTAAMRNELDVLNTVSRFTIQDLPDLQYKLINFGWTDDGFLTLNGGTEWNKLHEMLKRFLGDQAPYLIKVEGAIQSLLDLKPPADKEEVDNRRAQMINIVRFIVEIESEIEPKNRKPRIYKVMGEIIDEDKKFENLKPEIESFFACEDVEIILRGILNAFERFYNEEINASLKYFHLIQLTLLVEGLASDEKTFKPMLVDIVNKYCQRTSLIKDLYPHYPNALKKITDSITERNLFKTLRCLANLTQNPHIYFLTEELYNLKTLTNIEHMKQMIENMSTLKFTENQIRAIWLNPKFVYLIRQGIENQALVETIFLELCAAENKGDEEIQGEDDEPDPIDPIGFIPNGKVPRFIPKDIEEKLKPLFYSSNEPQFDWPTQWENISTVIQVFQIFVTRKMIPSRLPGILRKNLENNTDLKKVLNDHGALLYWNDEYNYFIHPWGLDTISTVLQLLMNTKLPKTIQNSDTRPQILPNLKINNTQEVINFPVTENWKRFTMNGFLNKIQDQLLNKITSVTHAPLVEYDNLEKTMDVILPYLIQQAKMHNSIPLQPNYAKKYIRYPPTDGKPRPGHIIFNTTKIYENEQFLMSKGDLITALFNCAEPIVTHQLLCSMMKAPIALPFLIPGINAESDTYKLMLPSIQNLIVKELEGIVPQPHLLTSPFRLIFTIRIGDMKGKLGKSTILNQLLMSHNHLFSCFAEPGVENGKPISRNGLVEFIWLSPSTINHEFYDTVIKQHYESNQPDMILLGNLHGDALNYQPMLELIKTYTSSFIVFWKANNWNDLKTKKNELNKCIGKGSSVLDLIVYPDATIVQQVGEHNIIGISTPEEIDGTKKKLYDVFKESILSNPKLSIPISTGVNVDSELTYTDPGIFNFIKQCGSNNKSYQIIDRRTGAGSGNLVKIKLSEFDDTTISCPETHALIEFIRQLTCQKIKESIVSPIKNQILLSTLCELMLAILNLQLPKRNMALTHFTYELEHLSRMSSKSPVERIVKLRKELESGIILLQQLQEQEIRELQDEVKSVMRRHEQTTLTTHDIFRYLINTESLQDIIPEKYFEYFISGFALEMFHPTHGSIMWMKPFHTVIQSIPEDTRIFVLSTLGLKASGKSTLLNRLFGVGFQEGPAGCTNGLHMRFLWIEENLKKVLNCDAFCIIDSEGLGAPENFIDENADLNERDIASFIIGISHLVLTNVLGDTMKELQDILEISFSTLSRIKNMLITPDMLFVQQQLEPKLFNTVSVTDENNNESDLLIEWKTFLNNVKILTMQNDMAIGLRVKSVYNLEIVNQRYRHDELVQNVRPLRKNEELNSLGYYKDIQTLYGKIIDICQQSSQIITLRNWYNFTENFWKTIKEIDTPSKFKNAAVAQDEINLKQRLSDVKHNIDLAFRSHDKIIDNIFTEQLEDFFNEDLIESLEEVEAVQDKTKLYLDNVDKELRKVINTCDIETGDIPCIECSTAFIQRENLFEDIQGRKGYLIIKEEILHYMNEVRLSIWGKYKQRVVAEQIKKGKSRELDGVLQDIRKEESELEVARIKFKQYVSTLQTVIQPGHRIDAEFAQEFATFPCIVSRLSNKYDLPNLEGMVAFDLGHYNKAVESSVNSPKREMLTWDQNDWLISKMEDLPGILLSDSGSDLYLVGMTREFKQKMNELLNDFVGICGEELEPDFKWEAHLYGIKVFKTFMEKKQADWDDNNNPIIQLEKRKDDFPDLFEDY